MFLFIAVIGGAADLRSESAEHAGVAVTVRLEGAIGPATASYVSDALDAAADQNAALIVIRMDTPGGLDTSMREIIRKIIASPVPVATFVSPSGARAASAGTYILYASHISAMMPGTNLGAATPVQIAGAPGLPQPSDQPVNPDSAGDEQTASDPAGPEGTSEQPAKQPSNAMEAKAVNDAVAYIRSLAQMRGRNAEWADLAVREAASLSAEDALEKNVIDLVAVSTTDLLSKIDGRIVDVNGMETVLESKALETTAIEPDWRTELLGAITNPNVALILMMIGVYGLIFEFMNPGAIYPGTVGAICLIVGLYALAALPVNYAGVGLVVLGMVLMVAEAFAPSFGALGIGGAIAFVLGAAIFIDTDAEAFSISWPVIAGTAATTLAFSLLVVRMAISSHGRKVVSGKEQMMDETCVVVDWSGAQGHVFVHGERWSAECATPLSEGQHVRVKSINGLTLTVAPE